MRQWFVACYLALAFTAPRAQELGASNTALQAEPVEEVLVSGEQPGPGLWKVTKDDRTLWIVGTHSPLPKKISWKSRNVADLVEQSQEVLIYGGVSARPNIGFFRGLTLLPSLLGAAKSPGGAELKDLLPPDVHARWLQLKAKYIGRDKGIERWRPTFALQELRSKAVNKSGLVYDRGVVNDVVRKAAQRRKIPIKTLQVKQTIQVDKPRELLKRFAQTPFNDVDCFVRSLDRLEQDVEDLRNGATAWATGDIAGLRQATERDTSTDCINILVKAALDGELTDRQNEKELADRVMQEWKRADEDLARQWLAAVDTALANNATTFAVAPISVLLRKDGYVDALKARGYTVEEPG